MIPIVRHLPLYIALFIVSSFCAVAQEETLTISMPDTLIRQGIVIRYPVFLQTGSNILNKQCTLRVEIPKSRIILQGVETVAGTLFTCKKPSITQRSTTQQSVLAYDIACSNPIQDSSGLAFYLLLESLAGEEKQVNIKTPNCIIGDSTVIPKASGGVISFSDPAVAPAGDEGMEINSPNPFVYTTSFAYYVAKDTKVEFGLYNTLGKLVKEFPVLQQKAGRYTFTIQVDNPIDFASGVYIIRMKTGQGTYHMSIVHEK